MPKLILYIILSTVGWLSFVAGIMNTSHLAEENVQLRQDIFTTRCGQCNLDRLTGTDREFCSIYCLGYLAANSSSSASQCYTYCQATNQDCDYYYFHHDQGHDTPSLNCTTNCNLK